MIPGIYNPIIRKVSTEILLTLNVDLVAKQIWMTNQAAGDPGAEVRWGDVSGVGTLVQNITSLFIEGTAVQIRTQSVSTVLLVRAFSPGATLTGKGPSTKINYSWWSSANRALLEARAIASADLPLWLGVGWQSVLPVRVAT